MLLGFALGLVAAYCLVVLGYAFGRALRGPEEAVQFQREANPLPFMKAFGKNAKRKPAVNDDRAGWEKEQEKG